MTSNGNQPDGGRTTAEQQTPPLAPAPETARPIPEPRASHYTVEFLVEIDGYHALIRGEDLTPIDMLSWTKRTVAGLKAQGFASVRRDVVINIPPPPAAAAAPARATRTEGEAPRRGREGQPLNAAAQRQDQPRGRGGQQRGGGGGGRPSAYHGEVYSMCPWCEGDIYDNRAKKAREGWKGPFFRCKDDGCGWIVWKGDGSYDG